VGRPVPSERNGIRRALLPIAALLCLLVFTPQASGTRPNTQFQHGATIVAETHAETRARHEQERRERRRNINHVWDAHWAPDYSGPTLPFNVAAALFEAAGMPGVTMAQMARGESGLRPGSAGVDAGGTVGYGILAVTSPFADSIVAKYGGYDQMLNPVKNAAAAAEIFRSNGIGAWYGTAYVTSTNAHYHGRLDLSAVLGGDSFRRALQR
jgi:hypothetical protein